MPEQKQARGKVKFGQVARLNKETSKSPKLDGLHRYVGLEHLEPGDLRIRAWGDIADGTTFTNRFRSGHVLFGKRRAYQKKVAVADFDGVCSGDIYVFEPKDSNLMLPDLLPFLCQTDEFFEHAVGTSAGSLSPRTNWKSLATYEFVVPPKDQQEEFATKLCAARASAESVARLLSAVREVRESYAQQWATAGSTAFADDGTVLPEQLPAGWVQLSIADLCNFDGGVAGIGPFGSDLVASDYAHSSGVPVVFVADVVRHRFTYTSEKYVTEEKASQLAAHQVVAGDVLVTKMGWPPGEACVVPDEFGPGVITADVIRLRTNPQLVRPQYLAAIMNSHWGAQQVVRIAPGTTRPKTTLRDFGKVRVALPPVEEQCSREALLLDLQTTIEELEQRLVLARTILQTMASTYLVSQ